MLIKCFLFLFFLINVLMDFFNFLLGMFFIFILYKLWSVLYKFWVFGLEEVNFLRSRVLLLLCKKLINLWILVFLIIYWILLFILIILDNINCFWMFGFKIVVLIFGKNEIRMGFLICCWFEVIVVWILFKDEI